MIRFSCPACKTVLQAHEQQGGSTISCPRCQAPMKVPGVPALAASAPTAPVQRPAAAGSAAIQHTPAASAPTVPMPLPPESAPAPLGPLPWWQRALHEARAVGEATWAQTRRLAHYGTGQWRRRTLRSSMAGAHLALGQQMFAAGSGDPGLRQQLAGLDEQIRAAQAEKKTTRALQKERQGLLRRLAEPTLTQLSAPPGADKEHQQARQLQAALQQHEQSLHHARVSLPPQGRSDWLRVGAGYAAACLLLLLVVGLVGPFSRKNLPTELSYVPHDSPAFFYLRVADIRNHDLVKDVWTHAEKDFAEDLSKFEKETGFAPGELDTFLAFGLPGMPTTGEKSKPIVIVTTVKPCTQEKVRTALGLSSEEKKIHGKSCYVSKEKAVHFASERMFFLAPPRELEKFLEKVSEKKVNGPLSDALRDAEKKHHLFLAINVEPIVKEVGSAVPPFLEPYKALLQTKVATMVFDIDAESKFELGLTFASDDQAKDGHKALENALAFGRLVLPPMLKGAGGNADTEKLLSELDKALNTPVQLQGKVVQMAFREKTDAESLRKAVASLKKESSMRP